MYPAPGYRKVKHNFLSDRLLLPPFSEVGLVDYPEETGSDIPHAHDDFQMIAFVTGTLRFSVNGENFSGTPGDVLLLPPQLRHSWRVVEAGSTVQIRLIPVFCEEYLELRPLLVSSACLIHMPPPQLRKLQRKISAEQNRLHPAANVMINAVLLEFLANALRCFSRENQNISSASSEGITRVIRHLRANYRRKISLQEMASMACLGVSQFSVLFRRQTGKSPTAFLIGIRLRKAMEMIFSTDLKMHEIAHSCGFDSVSYFNRQFHAVYGVTPLSCRRKFSRQE
ncbi:MAG: AraC family transcriptional regulator [Lentisphaeria bacterium]|nr:MAG: AraC family transcriptional regulator [Lentisphaeria bacterium]